MSPKSSQVMVVVPISFICTPPTRFARASPSRIVFHAKPRNGLPRWRACARPSHARIVLISGFEQFNAVDYRAAAEEVEHADVSVFTENDLGPRGKSASDVAEALSDANAVVASLVFDYEQVEWLRARLPPSASVFVFESALELAAETRVGDFSMGGAGAGASKGMPKPVANILRKLGVIGREEDKLAGYVQMLNTAPKLLRLVPGGKAKGLTQWLTVYSYWNAGGKKNIAAMYDVIAAGIVDGVRKAPPPVIEAPNIGLVHPDHDGYFESPREYMDWYLRKFKDRAKWPVVGILLYRKHVISQLDYIPQLITYFEDQALLPVPVFITGVEAHIIVRDYLTTSYEEGLRHNGTKLYGSYKKRKSVAVDAIVSTIGFPLVGGPAGSMEGGRNADVGQKILSQMNVPYFVAAPLIIQDLQSWNEKGIGGLQSVVLFSLPELDGAIDTVVIGGLVGDEIQLVPDRLGRLTSRVRKWIALRKKENKDKRVAIILYGFPPSLGATGTAALLNVPESLTAILKRLKEEGYDVGDACDLSGEDIIVRVKDANEVVDGGRLPVGTSIRAALEQTTTVPKRKVKWWLGEADVQRVEEAWHSDFEAPSHLKSYGDDFLLGGVRFGNIWIGVQPPLGIVGDPMRLLFERDLSPHPQYVAFYRWLENGFGADALLHFGMHGTSEWLCGLQLGNNRESWSDIVLGSVPNLYMYAQNNPSESAIAKRRGYGTIISHSVPPYGRAGLYNELEDLKALSSEFAEIAQGSSSEERTGPIQDAIIEKMRVSGLDRDLDLDLDAVQKSMAEGTSSAENRIQFVLKIREYLKVLETRLFSSGLHTFGKAPSQDDLLGYADAILDSDTQKFEEAERKSIAARIVNRVLQKKNAFSDAESSSLSDATVWNNAVTKRAIEAVELLSKNDGEVDALVKGLRGEYIPAQAGGDVLRDGAGCLPTGRNIHSLDPYRIPSDSAFATGRGIAERVISTHLQEGNGYPETVAVPLWGLDNIKTKGEAVGIVLGLVGAEAVKDATGRVSKFELVPLETLGRPRCDVILNLSGIFRDSFENLVFLLDDLFVRASSVDEPVELNYVRKHALEISSESSNGMSDGKARLFSNPPGDYGSMVSEQVTNQGWDSGEELAETFVTRNSFAYGRGRDGKEDRATLKKLLGSTDRIVQQIDSVEYGLSDIQEYYANTGALLKAARVANKSANVKASIVESFGRARDDGAGRELKDLDDVLRMELRTRLLNPKWATKMLENGSGGAFEVSARMTALIGWGGTAEFAEDFVFEQAAQRYVLDKKNSELLKKASPEAYKNILSRFLEAHGRGIWSNASEEVLDVIREQLDIADASVEGVNIS